MATIREDFFTQLSAGAKWDVGVSINRTNPLPLDVYSVFDSRSALDSYVAGKFSYPGQILALIKADETIIYYLDQNKQLKEIGANLSADGKTIAINDEGKISLHNLPTDLTKTYNAVLVNGELSWVEPSATTVEGLDTRLTAAEREIDSLTEQVTALGSAFEFKGTADHFANDKLYGTDGNEITGTTGDVYQVGDKEYAYDGTKWVELGFNIDLSSYATKDYADQAEADALSAAKAYTDEKVGDIDFSTLATKEELKATDDKAVKNAEDIATNVTAIANNKTLIESVQNVANAAATKTEFNELKGTVEGHTTTIGTLQSTLNETKGKAEANETAITSLDAIVKGHTTSVNDLTQRMSAAETSLSETKGTVASHTTEIGKNAGDIANLTTALGITNGKVAANETAIGNINTTLGEKANSADVYTKTEIEGIIGTRDGKTVVELIKASEYNDTQVKKDISANTTLINTLIGADTGKSVRTIAADEINTLIGGVSDADTIEGITSLIEYVNTNGATVKGMQTDIANNTAAITKLNGGADVEGSVLAMIAANAPVIATTEKAGIVKSVASTVENGVMVAEDGTMSVNNINVNKLSQTEGEYLVLDGGNAGVIAE